MYQRIVVAFDESPLAQRALLQAIELAVQLKAHLTIATVAEPLPSVYNVAAAVAPEILTEASEGEKARLSEKQLTAVAVAKSRGLEAEALLIEGQEVAGILDAIKHAHADLLVVGLHRHSGVFEVAGTLRKLANTSPCSILGVV